MNASARHAVQYYLRGVCLAWHCRNMRRVSAVAAAPASHCAETDKAGGDELEFQGAARILASAAVERLDSWLPTLLR